MMKLSSALDFNRKSQLTWVQSSKKETNHCTLEMLRPFEESKHHYELTEKENRFFYY